jgi:hypothetical protein
MSYVATIMARLGLDTKNFSGPMRDANREVDVHERKINNAARGHDNLLRSSHRVSRQIENMSRTLLSGGDAADIFGTGLESVGRSLNLNLGALAALGVGAVGVQQIAKLHEEFEKVNKEVEILLHSGGNADFNTLSALEGHLTKVADQLERLKKESKGGFIQNIKDAFGENFFTEDGELLPDSSKAGRRRSKQTAALEALQDADQRSIATKRRRKNANKNDRFAQFDPNNSDEFIEAATPGPKQNGYLAAAIAEELAQGMRELVQTIISKADEKVKLSLSDLAGGPGYGNQNTASLSAIWNAQQAKEVQRLEALAKDQMLNQNDFAGAKATMSQAENLRHGISSLKDSEKTTEFRDALDASGRLKNIETNTGGMFKGR